jgi:sugar phosphate isomerase/epimerase
VQVTGQRNRAGYGINTYSFTHTQRARDCLEQLADIGYRRFEIMLVPGHFWPSLDGDAGRRQVQSLLVRKSLQILSLNQPNLDVNLSSVVPEMREHSCRVIASAIELAAAWNAKGVVVNPGKCNPVLPTATEKTNRLLPLVARRLGSHSAKRRCPVDRQETIR